MPAATMPTRSGYTFEGYWDTSASTGGTQYYTAAGASARNWDKSANTTLFARWTAAKTVTLNTISQTVAQGERAYYNITTSGIANGTTSFSTQWYSNSTGTTSTSAPAGVGDFTSPINNNSTTKEIPTSYYSTTPTGTYYFKVTIDGVQSSNVATLIVTAVAPTSISFSNSVIYTYPGKVNNMGMSFSPSGAVFANSIFTETSSHPTVVETAGALSSSTGSEVIRITGSDPGSTASQPHSVTITAPSNTGGKTVTIKSKFAMKITPNISSFTGWFNDGTSYSWYNRASTRIQYVRAYYGANETEWARANNVDADMHLTKIGTGNYTITSSSADITISKEADGVNYKLVRSATSGVRAVTLTITVGSGSTAQTYRQVINLLD